MDCHFLLHGIFPTRGIKLTYLMSPALAGRLFTTSATLQSDIYFYSFSFQKWMHLFIYFLLFYFLSFLKVWHSKSFKSHSFQKSPFPGPLGAVHSYHSHCPFTLLERSSWTHGSMIPNDDCDSLNLGILLFIFLFFEGILLFKDVSVKTDGIFSVSTPLFV